MKIETASLRSQRQDMGFFIILLFTNRHTYRSPWLGGSVALQTQVPPSAGRPPRFVGNGAREDLQVGVTVSATPRHEVRPSLRIPILGHRPRMRPTSQGWRKSP
jgi:hypothetical protein